MNTSSTLESLQFELEGTHLLPPFHPVLVGIVGSGNLEVMFETHPAAHCLIDVNTSARGFRPVWEAVLRDFQDRHGLAGLRISINDMGATPAVVGLRLQQGLAQLLEDTR